MCIFIALHKVVLPTWEKNPPSPHALSTWFCHLESLVIIDMYCSCMLFDGKNAQVACFYAYNYVKSELKRDRKTGIFICWFTPQMTMMARPGQKQQPGTQFRSPLGWQGLRCLDVLPLLSLVYKQKAGSEMKQPGQEPRLMWDAGIAGIFSVICSTTTLAPKLTLLS